MSGDSEELQIQLKNLQKEFQEQDKHRFQEQSKDYEEALEAEIQEKDEKILELEIKLEELAETADSFKAKYLQNEKEVVKLQNQLEDLHKRFKDFMSQKCELEQLNDYWENSARILEFSKQDLEERLNQAEENVILYKEELDEIQQQKEVEIQRLKDQCMELEQELTVLKEQSSDKIPELEQALQKALEQQQKLRKEIDSAPKLPAAPAAPAAPQPIQRDVGRIRVLARVRPVFANEDKSYLEVSSTDIKINSTIRGHPPNKVYNFEKVFNQEANNEDVFQELQSDVEQVLHGGKACIVAYGQTGSGKTYTMKALMRKTAEILQRNSPNAKCRLYCVEVYNERVRDLMDESATLHRNWKELLKTCNKFIESPMAAMQQLLEASERRITKSTEANMHSSRSHAIYTITIQEGQIQFVDLAGSERLSQSKATGDMQPIHRLKETLAINRSLSALQDVIVALESKSAHVPFRNSVLTQILHPTLSGLNFSVNMIMAINPSSVSETLCTLALGTRIKAVDLTANFRSSITNGKLHSEEVERTLNLLEQERTEKNEIIRKAEKLERDLEGYKWGIKERDQKIQNLTQRLKKQHRELNDENDKLRREMKILRQQTDELGKKVKQMSSTIETERRQRNRVASGRVKEPIKRRPPSAPPAPPNQQHTRSQNGTPMNFTNYSQLETINSLMQGSRLPRPSFLRNRSVGNAQKSK